MAQSERTRLINDADVCKQYTPLVEGMVRRLHVPDPLRADAKQEGFIGLLAALRNYNPDSPVHFSVFAGPYVKGAIIRRIYTRTQITEFAAEESNLDDRSTRGTYEIDNEVVLGVQMEAWMATLSLADVWIVRRLYWEDADTDEIAKELGITRRRVNQRHAEILRQGAIALDEEG
jgi:RNA polymerase sigma factor (sigma-70 family)